MMEFPKVDPRSAEELFRQAQSLALDYCRDWRPEDQAGGFGPTLFKLFARLAEIIIGQLNRIPEKHLLAFYDFIGMDFEPARAAKVPLTFRLAAGAREVVVPERTKVAAAGSETVFETLAALQLAELKIAAAYSVNPWADTYTGHGATVSGSEAGFSIFGGDGAESPVEHLLGLADPLFGTQTPADLTLTFCFSNFQEGFWEYFAQPATGNGTALTPTIVPNQQRQEVTFQFSKLRLPRTKLQGRENHWLIFRPAKPLPWGKEPILPEISGISATLSAQELIPELILVNDTPVEILKGFYPFGETPRTGDACYIRCEEALAGLQPGIGGSVELTFEIRGGVASEELQLAWEYWDGIRWAAFTVTSDSSNRFLAGDPGEFTGTVRLTCPGIKEITLNNQPGKWIRVRIARGGYGSPGHYQAVLLDEILKADFGMGAQLIEIMKSDSKLGEKFSDRLQQDEPEAKGFKGRVDGFLLEFQQKLLARLGEKMITSGSVYQPPNFKAPFIVSIRAAYSFTKTTLAEALTENYWECREIDLTKGFQPFPPAFEKPAFFLGLEGNPANQPVTFFFSAKPKISGAVYPRLMEPGFRGEPAFENKCSGLSLFCSISKEDSVSKEGGVSKAGSVSKEGGVSTGNADGASGAEWTELGVEDETEGFLASGMMKLVLPGNIARRKLFGISGYWLKFSFREGGWMEPPVLRGIFPNTVWAEQAAVIRDEVLGSSNGRPGQVFHFCRRTLLAEALIEVREPCIPGPEELRKLRNMGGCDPVRLVKNEAGDPLEIWVRWDEVPAFGQSDSLSRHYQLDRLNGRILFGDGVHGMIPPVLPHNLVARFYKWGGGAAGNQGPGMITELKGAIPRVAGVTNPEAAAGGKDLETLGDFLNRVPVALKTGGLAVTREDYERLAREASIQVLKAKCVAGDNADMGSGAITVIIAPVPAAGRVPEAGLTAQVADYLKRRALAPIRERIQVIGPDYKWIDLVLTIRPSSLSAGTAIRENLCRKLERFFDLVEGGPRGQGWDFGEDLFLSDVAVVVAEAEGVAQIEDLLLRKKDREGREEERSKITAADGKTWITLKPWELPGLGAVTVNLTGGES